MGKERPKGKQSAVEKTNPIPLPAQWSEEAVIGELSLGKIKSFPDGWQMPPYVMGTQNMMVAARGVSVTHGPPALVLSGDSWDFMTRSL